MRYDIVVVGGGLAGSAIASAMAGQGVRVLVIEETARFRDRVRGEGLHPWGVAEARALGLCELLERSCGHLVPCLDTYIGSRLIKRRNLVETTSSRAGSLDFHHPEMQEVLLDHAASMGAEVLRSARVEAVVSGTEGATLSYKRNRSRGTVRTRLVVGADGRGSRVRQSCGFQLYRAAENLLIASTLFEGLGTSDEAVSTFTPPFFGQSVMVFPLRGGRARVYFMSGRRQVHHRLSGRTQAARFVEYTIESGVPRHWFEQASVIGPLAQFEAAPSLVDEPYRPGVVLVGDAAGWANPCWGCGMAATLRDARSLSQALLGCDDWDLACKAYSLERTRHARALQTLEAWMSRVVYEQGAEADRIREHALKLLAAGHGPDLVGEGASFPTDEATRVSFLGI